MKKLVCLLLALGMMTAAFSCGEDEEESSRKSSATSVSDKGEDEKEKEKPTRGCSGKPRREETEETEPETETEEETEPETEAEPAADNWQDIYFEKLGSVMESPAYVSDWGSGSGFSLEDLDSDGTPELFISYDYTRGVDVFTCDGEDLIYLGEVSDYGTVSYIPDKKLLVNTEYDTAVRISTDTYLALSGSSFVTVASAGIEYNELGEIFNWYINDECTDEDTYNDIVELYDGGRFSIGHEFRMNDTEIELAIYGGRSWEQAYSYVLSEVATWRGDETAYPSFSLYDITGDGTPELFISQGMYHVAGVDIYSYDDRLIFMGTLGSYGGVTYSVDTEKMVTGDVHMGYEYGADLEIRDNRFARVFYYYNNCGAVMDEADWEFEINGKKVTQTEYEAALDSRGLKRYVWLGGDNMLDLDTAENVMDGEYVESTIGEYTPQ